MNSIVAEWHENEWAVLKQEMSILIPPWKDVCVAKNDFCVLQVDLLRLIGTASE